MRIVSYPNLSSHGGNFCYSLIIIKVRHQVQIRFIIGELYTSRVDFIHRAWIDSTTYFLPKDHGLLTASHKVIVESKGLEAEYSRI